MSRFIAERDPEFEDQAVVVELSEDYDIDGSVVGFTSGPEALDNAQAVAGIINETGHQLLGRRAEGLRYTVAYGKDF